MPLKPSWRLAVQFALSLWIGMAAPAHAGLPPSTVSASDEAPNGAAGPFGGTHYAAYQYFLDPEAFLRQDAMSTGADAAFPTVQLDYYLEVSGPESATFVPLVLTYDLKSSGEQQGTLDARATLTVGMSDFLPIFDAATCLESAVGMLTNQCGMRGGGPPSSSGQVQLMVQANAPIPVTLWAQVFVSGDTPDGNDLLDHSGSAQADAAFMIDPSFVDAGLYTLSFSPNAASIDEAGSLSSMALGMALVAGGIRRSRRDLSGPPSPTGRLRA